VVHSHVIQALCELADEELQRRLWRSSGEGGAEVSSFSECVSQLFDDSGLGVELDRGHLVFGEELDGRLRSLSVTLHKVNDLRPPDDVIADPLLAEVRAVARLLAQDLGST